MKTYELEFSVDRSDDLLSGHSQILQAVTHLPLATAEFLERQFRQAPRNARLALHLKVHSGSEDNSARLRSAISKHYEAALQTTRGELEDYRRDLLQALLYGSLFLALCLGSHELLIHLLGERIPRVLDEGLIIIGWVAMWRPAELLTYDWLPLVRRQRMQRKLSHLSLQIDQVG